MVSLVEACLGDVSNERINSSLGTRRFMHRTNSYWCGVFFKVEFVLNICR